MPGYTDATQTTVAAPDASKLVELGGRRSHPQGRNNIDGASITWNAATAHSTPAAKSPPTARAVLRSAFSLLPTTRWLPRLGCRPRCFLARAASTFPPRATSPRPIVNAFLLPQGYSNGYFYKTYFSTYAATDAVNVSSLGGDITFAKA